MAEIIPFEVTDYLQQAKDRETYAFEDAVVFNKFLELLVGQQTELLETFRQLMQERSIDTAVGAQLDIIGNIVGQDRTLIEADLIPYFGFIGALAPESFGDFNDPSLGGFYWDLTKPLAGNITLSDDQYRIFIKAKIMKNLTKATPEDVIAFVQFVFGVERVYISLDQDAHAVIFVSDDISLFEKVLLRYFTQRGTFRSYFIPKTLGVQYDYGEFSPTDFFAFWGVPGAKGYGTLIPAGNLYDGSLSYDGTALYDETEGWVLDPNVGGKYASLL
jgi:hypothetical protein